MPKGSFRVSWQAQGNDNFIVDVVGPSGDKLGLVNEIPPDPASGQFLFPSPGGTFNFQVQAATLSWKLTFDQIIWPPDPRPAPAPAPIAMNGANSTVTNPVYIPKGTYKLTWTSQGHGNFIVSAHWGDSGDSGALVNEIPPDPASGETIFTSGGGDHVFEVVAASQQWTLTLTPL